MPTATKPKPAALPRSVESTRTAFEIDQSPGWWGAISDVHIPFQDNGVIKLFAAEAKRRKVVGILLNGDILDFYKVSAHLRDPSAESLKSEIDKGRKFFAWLREQFPNTRIVYKEGNHEERLKHYIYRQAPELWGLDDVTLQALVKLDTYGIEYIGDRRMIRLGKLPVVHGHEFQRGFAPPVNAARGLFLKAQMSAICVHHHQTSSHSSQRLDGKTIKTWSLGCACNLKPDYSPFNNWNHGFAFVNVNPDRTYHVDNLTIIGGRFF